MTISKDSHNQSHRAIFFLKMAFALLLFMLSIDLLTVSMLQLNNELAKEVFQATNNPFVGLFIGLLMTALIQSSSTVTAMIVAVVASGSLTLTQAVPLVMGANIGTTITSTLVSFSFIMKRGEFKKALSAGVLHDVFNIITVIILFPLEFYFGFLSQSAQFITHTFFESKNSAEGPIRYNAFFTRPFSLWLVSSIKYPIIALIGSILLVFGAIKILSATVFKTFISDNYKKVSKHIFKTPAVAFLYGIFFTSAVQSSTVTTSLIVPAVANRRISLIKVFPFIIGANIGTTITALIAAIYNTEAAISIAIVHLLFNVIGALIFMPINSIRNIPVKIATYLGKESVKTRIVGFAYILLTFFIIPFLLIYFNRHEDMTNSQANEKKVNSTEIPANN
ncbi:Na/Pi symporter [Belliella sp. DSM 111904]|uniref:Na/Pi symporter n=1 Tax=Belliella filtrata TaxID=2923435 RepID=A0ABS9V145_9BACT|nr:Na/Pi symporter [Belliella filtrata]MCH7410133.1 Na/Pi symporter [Belliella filtrata]